MSNEARIRRIADADWDGIVAMESRAYAELGLSEERAALESRVRVSPTTCCALDLARGWRGYLLALPYPMFRYPDLDRTEEFAFPSRNLHLHDLVIAEESRRGGLAQRLLHHLTAAARSHGYEQISLVAVAGSETYWSARGFAGHQEVVPPGSYGPARCVHDQGSAGRSHREAGVDRACRAARRRKKKWVEAHAPSSRSLHSQPVGDRRAVLLPRFPVRHLGVANPCHQDAPWPDGSGGGLLLMAAGVGAVASFPVVAMLMRRLGSRRLALLSALGLTLLLVALAAAPNYPVALAIFCAATESSWGV